MPMLANVLSARSGNSTHVPYVYGCMRLAALMAVGILGGVIGARVRAGAQRTYRGWRPWK
jgi:hypothetical protein